MILISSDQTFSEEFIREFQNKVDWYHIIVNPRLPESFIREIQDRVDWDWISHYHPLSELSLENRESLDNSFLSQQENS